MRFSITIVTALLAAFATASPVLELENRQVDGSDRPDPHSVWIEGLTWSGSGCVPSDQVGTILSDDRSTVTIIYPNFQAVWTGDNRDIALSRKNCQVNFKLRYPGGFSYTILSAQYRGQIIEDPSCTATMKTVYYFSGQTAQYSTDFTQRGPFNENYLKDDRAINAAIVWSPCGAQGMLNTNAQAQVRCSAKNDTGLISVDSQDNTFKTIINLQWRRCPR